MSAELCCSAGFARPELEVEVLLVPAWQWKGKYDSRSCGSSFPSHYLVERGTAWALLFKAKQAFWWETDLSDFALRHIMDVFTLVIWLASGLGI